MNVLVYKDMRTRNEVKRIFIGRGRREVNGVVNFNGCRRMMSSSGYLFKEVTK